MPITYNTTPTTLISTGLSAPAGIALDSAGNIYVADPSAHNVKEYSAAGTLIRTIGTNLGNDYGVAVDSLGNVYTTAWNNPKDLRKLDASNNYAVSTLVTGAAPMGIALDSSGNIYLPQYGFLNSLQKYLPAGGAPILSFPTVGAPSSVAVDASGNIYVAGTNTQTVGVYDPTGMLINTINTGLTGQYGIAVDRYGDVFVSSLSSGRVKEFSASGSLVQTLNTGLNGAFGLALDSADNLLVVNYYTNTVVKFSVVAPPAPINSDSITVAGQVLSDQTVTNGSSWGSGNGSSITTTGNLNAHGGSAQNNPLSAQNTSSVSSGQVNTLPTLMAVKTQKILGLIGAVTAEIAESMMAGMSASATDSTKIAGSPMIAPPDGMAVENIAQPGSDTPMEAIGYPVYGYNYFYLSDFQGSSNFRVTGQSGNTLTTNFLELVNNTGGSQTVDISGYQGIVVATPGVNVTGLTTNNYLGALGGGSYTFGAGNQKLFLMGPNSTIVGGGGVDTVRFLGVGKGSANITQEGSDVSIWSDWLDTGSGVTYLHNVARAQFDDGSVAFDTAAGQNGGAVYRLYEAAFHRAGDQQGLGYWINQMDNGSSLQTIANQFLTSQEFINLYGNSPSAATYVNALYNNVLGRAADAAGAAYWQGQLQAGFSKAQLLIQFAESAEGVSHTAAQIAQGVHYQQWVQ